MNVVGIIESNVVPAVIPVPLMYEPATRPVVFNTGTLVLVLVVVPVTAVSDSEFGVVNVID